MHPLSGEYPLTQLERVVFGAGSVGRLGGELDRLGASRAVVVTGRTLGTSPLLDRVTGALGSRCVEVFAGARQHVPATAVADLIRALDTTRADCLVSFGGGSPIDTAKAAAQGRVAALPHVAVPTTLGLDNISWQLPADVAPAGERPFDWCLKDLRPILAR